MRKIIILVVCVLAASAFSIYPPLKSKTQDISKTRIIKPNDNLDYVIDSLKKRQRRIDQVTDLTLDAAKRIYSKANK